MKNKGFTLIELLAVILILGIIALIAIPTVTNIIKESKRGAFKSSVQNLINAVETQCQVQQMKGEELTTSYSFTNGKVDNELNIKGDLPKSGTIIVDSSCNTTVNVSDDTFTVIKQIDSDEIEIKVTNEIVYTCKRAITLHTEECTRTGSYWCDAAGYTAEGAKGITTITYGNLGTKGILTSGDAFDCDVNGDGTYDPETERFYYVSDYYNTIAKKFEPDKAVLIYYNNTSYDNKGNVRPDNSSTGVVAFNSKNNNYEGPINVIANLPLKTQWNNISLINEKRLVITETGVNSITHANGEVTKTLPTVDYTSYSARLLTTKEVESACGITVGTLTRGELDNCDYLLENTNYSSNTMSDGYWLETSRDDGTLASVWDIDGLRIVGSGHANANAYFGARPVIELYKTEIAY